MALPLAEQVAIITGAASGIGAAIALHLADLGASVLVNHKDTPEPAEAIAAEIRRLGRRALAFPADVTDRRAIAAMVAAAQRELGPVEVLVNNVGGLIESRRFVEVDDALWDAIFALNLKSAYMCSQAVLPGMLERKRGRIVNVSSIAAETGGPGSIPYAAAKGAMNTMTVGLARELAEHGIRVNAVAPGLIATPFHAGHERTLSQRVAAIPLGRMGEPEEVARVVGFLVSERGAHVNGQVWTVAGGR